MNHHMWRRIFTTSLLLLMILPLKTQPVYALNITVNTADDELNSDGDCSLREAIQAANTDTVIDACTAGSGNDTITIPAGIYTLSILGANENFNATGDLDIRSDLTLNGASNATTILDGGNIDRVLDIHPGFIVQFTNLTVQNGSPGTRGGGISNKGTLSLANSIVTSNTGINFGGGINNTGTMSIDKSTISDNDMAGSTNLSGGGGGIFNEGQTTITDSTVSGNTTLGRGGGIYNLDSSLTITNSTVSGNTGLNGGGIFNRFSAGVSITQTTITDNKATDNGGGVWNFGGTVSVANTIVGINTATTLADDCAGVIASLGYNLASDATCAFGAIGDLNSTNPLLAALANNGGQTSTHALLPGSPAIDPIPLSACPISLDQRGISRPQGAGCDIGSYEAPPTLPAQCKGVIGDYTIIQGTIGNDVLTGGVGQDLIFGYEGNDKLQGKTSDDCLVGGPGNDNMDGGAGDDVLLGDSGEDRIAGGSGNDDIYGGADRDIINADSGDDNVWGEDGNDLLRGHSGDDYLDGGLGVDVANGGSGTDICTAETMSSCSP